MRCHAAAVNAQLTVTIKTESLCKQEDAVWEAAALQMHSMHAQASTAINFKWQIHEN